MEFYGLHSVISGGMYGMSLSSHTAPDNVTVTYEVKRCENQSGERLITEGILATSECLNLYRLLTKCKGTKNYNN